MHGSSLTAPIKWNFSFSEHHVSENHQSMRILRASEHHVLKNHQSMRIIRASEHHISENYHASENHLRLGESRIVQKHLPRTQIAVLFVWISLSARGLRSVAERSTLAEYSRSFQRQLKTTTRPSKTAAERYFRRVSRSCHSTAACGCSIQWGSPHSSSITPRSDHSSARKWAQQSDSA